jgi:hypothetical protein
VLPLDALSREIVAECAAAGESGTLAALLAEYVAPGENDESRRTADVQTIET